MKTTKLLGILILFFCTFGFISCSNDEKEGRKITDYKEYALTVASEKLPGVVTSCRNYNQVDVYAVMKEGATEWEALPAIEGFEYEPGYEYKIRISETSYLDYTMGDPAWTEYHFLEIISKEEKTSANLPLNFIPAWYYEEFCAYIDADFQYAIDADHEQSSENDLMANEVLSSPNLRCYITGRFENWFLLDTEKNVVEQGILKTERKDYEDFPEAYRLLPPKGNVLGYMQWKFIKECGSKENATQYDVFICGKAVSKSPAPESVVLWLYQDLTVYYQNKYPETNVKAVVICYKMKI